MPVDIFLRPDLENFVFELYIFLVSQFFLVWWNLYKNFWSIILKKKKLQFIFYRLKIQLDFIQMMLSLLALMESNRIHFLKTPLSINIQWNRCLVLIITLVMLQLVVYFYHQLAVYSVSGISNILFSFTNKINKKKQLFNLIWYYF